MYSRRDLAARANETNHINLVLGSPHIAFAARGRRKIDAAQQRAELGGADLPPPLAVFLERHGVFAFFQALVSQREPIAVPVQDLHPVVPPAGE